MNILLSPCRRIILLCSLLHLACTIFPEPTISVPDSVKQGDVIQVLVYPFEGDKTTLEMILSNKETDKTINKVSGFEYTPKRKGKIKLKVGVGVVGIDPLLATGDYELLVRLSDKKGVKETAYAVQVTSNEWDKETIQATETMKSIKTKPSSVSLSQEQSRELWQVLNRKSKPVYFFSTFHKPVKDDYVITSTFGSQRIFEYSSGKSSVSAHRGEDFASPRGTPIYSSGAGIVTMSEDRVSTGNTVVIEHAPGIATSYYHLDSLDVKEGEEVKTGERIGEMGSTGFSTGPHLHWQLNIHGTPVDPMPYLEKPLIDLAPLVKLLK